MLSIVNQKADFFSGYLSDLNSYSQNGCGVVCATNVIQTLRIQEDLPMQPPETQRKKILSAVNPNYNPNVFGAHGSGGTLTPLNVGSLRRFIEKLIATNDLEKTYQVRAYQKVQHEPYLKHEGNITFIESLPENVSFTVTNKEAKIILVEISNNDLPPSESYLATHFYTVASFKDGIVTLHDPNHGNKLFRFQLTPYNSGDFKTMELKPLDSNYVFDRTFPQNLHFMINGYVSVKLAE